MIIFRGWGILSILIAAGCVLLFAYLGKVFWGSIHANTVQLGAALGFFVAAAANWFLGRSLNRPKREAGAGVLNRHSLFFVPMEWASVIMLIAGIFFIISSREI